MLSIEARMIEAGKGNLHMFSDDMLPERSSTTRLLALQWQACQAKIRTLGLERVENVFICSTEFTCTHARRDREFTAQRPSWMFVVTAGLSISQA